jgi:Fe/S biogenesis protein NfuA
MTDEGPDGQEPLVSVSEAARELVLSYRARSEKPDPERLAMWVEVTGVSGADFAYDMYLKYADEAAPSDAVVPVHDDLTIVVPEASVEQLRGATVDVSEGDSGGGLYVDNPNSPSPVVGAQRAGAPKLEGEVAERVMQIIEQQINPSIAAHGGACELVAVEDEVAYVRLSGGCQGCGMATVTLTQGIEVAIREVAPEITSVVDVTDHASGSNPYYEPAKDEGVAGGK